MKIGSDIVDSLGDVAGRQQHLEQRGARDGASDLRAALNGEIGCHKVRPHPGSMSFSAAASERNDEWVHFVKPSETVLENMREAQAETGIGLPLDPHDGEIFCATCHNPHDFKVGGEHGSESPAAADKLRTDNICQVCHDK